jgi:hypothetical protein
LVGGDKSGDWKGWYADNVPVADERFTQHQAAVEREVAGGRSAKAKKQKERGRKR